MKILPSLIAAWALSCESPAPRAVPAVPVVIKASPASSSTLPTSAPTVVIDAATDAPVPVAIQVVSPPRPEEPATPGRACRKDDDCDLVPDDCTKCPPCEAEWRRAASHELVRTILERRKRVSCPPISCPDCPPPLPAPPGLPQLRPASGFIGNRAVCENGQCAVVE